MVMTGISLFLLMNENVFELGCRLEFCRDIGLTYIDLIVMFRTDLVFQYHSEFSTSYWLTSAHDHSQNHIWKECLVSASPLQKNFLG